MRSRRDILTAADGDDNGAVASCRGVCAKPSSFCVESAVSRTSAVRVVGSRDEGVEVDVRVGVDVGADVDTSSFWAAGVEVGMGVGRCPLRGTIGTHSRNSGTFSFCVWVSEVEASCVSTGSVSASMGS
jgi:hypothetical protein